MDSLIKDFLQESNENLDHLDQDFVQLETDPENRELLGSIFRSIHTLKGTCGFLGFPKLEVLAHAGENLLSLLRAGELKLSTTIADALLEMVDNIREILRDIEATGQEGTREFPELLERLKSLQQAPGTLPPHPKPEAVMISNEAPSPRAAGTSDVLPPAKPSSKTRKPEIAAGRLGGALVRKGRVKQEEILYALQLQQEGDGRRLGEILVALGLVSQRDIEEALSGQQRRTGADAAVRVDVALLERQMNLVSELVLLRNRLLQLSANKNDHDLETAVHGVNLVTAELRKNVMKARMQPVNQLYEKLPRLIRDVSKDLGKKIALETVGGQTELDKTLLEAIKDPVTHILRNSMDHGIESPEKRLAASKNEFGTIRVRAYHEGGNFQLEISDDGAGINTARVKEKALAKGVITELQARTMSEEELQSLIFAPGLSTAEKVTSVSGRGVGMDVVKTNIEQIGGRVRLESQPGVGTRIQLEIPLTLATIPALTVISGECVFAISQAALVEVLGFAVEEKEQRIESIEGVKMLRFRGTVLPFLSLREDLHLNADPVGNTDSLRIVVVQSEGRRFALEVDVIRHCEEIVIKPLSKYFKHIGLFTGAAILGDGNVALILDLSALARRCGISLQGQARLKTDQKTADRSRRRLVLVSASHGERMALPIECVERLESLPDTAREQSGGFDVMQYRGEILRLVRLEAFLDEQRSVPRAPVEAPQEEGKFAAVVARGRSGAPVIFEVARILGIVELEGQKLTPPSRSGVEGSLVIHERVTELLNMEFLLARAAGGDLMSTQLVPIAAEPGNGR